LASGGRFRLEGGVCREEDWQENSRDHCATKQGNDLQAPAMTRFFSGARASSILQTLSARLKSCLFKAGLIQASLFRNLGNL
jgi:hypothetical protein